MGLSVNMDDLVERCSEQQLLSERFSAVERDELFQ